MVTHTETNPCHAQTDAHFFLESPALICSRMLPELELEFDFEREFELERPLLEFEDELLERLLEDWLREALLELFCELGRLSMTAPRSVSILAFSRLYPRL
jgi:hypothetical protein